MTHPYVSIAREAIEAWSEQRAPRPVPLPPELDRGSPVFVSLHDAGGALRGCIGHTVTDEPSITREITAMAVAAASEDPRFPPIRPQEVAQLQVEVSVLAPPEPVTDLQQLDPRMYGVVVTDGRRRGVLLPDLDGVDTVAQQLAIVRRKAGIAPDAPVRVERFRVEVFR